ncbi:MAG: ABC transporter ATP-binding protein [Deltaproteobacteria bacterium]|nr:MAG: ABC transporter ATP-binding protein [Deltaproteobacteria bacterium]
MSILKNKWYKFFLYPGSTNHYILMLVCLGLTSILGFIIPGYLLRLSKSFGDAELFYQTIYQFALIYFGIYLVRTLFQLVINLFIRDLMASVRNRVYKTWLLHFQGKDESEIEQNYPQGEVIARIMSDSQALRELVTSGAFGIIIDLFYVLSFLIGFIQLNKFSGIFLALVEVFVAILLIWGGKYMRDVFHSVRKSKGLVSQAVSNVVGGVNQTYFTDHDNYGSKTGKVAFDDFLYKQLKANNWDATYYSVAESLYPLFLALVVFIFPYSEITEAAIILALVELIQRSINPIKGIAGKITNIQRALTGLARIGEFTDDLGHYQSSDKKIKIPLISFLSLKVEIKSFHYPRIGKNESRREFYLRDINFEAFRGELIGIVGLSGCGKSTLLNIISANLIPQEGDLTIFTENNRPYATFPENMAKYREQVGIVSQDSHIFSESLAFNITLEEEPKKDFYTFWDWAREKIHYLKVWNIRPNDQINPLVLSPGQKQLLSAIRSCYLKKTIVLLDEISSALDSELELALREVILLIQKQSLAIIVAHRLETIINADNILVLEEGRIVGHGPHKQLVESSKEYKKFIDELSH